MPRTTQLILIIVAAALSLVAGYWLSQNYAARHDNQVTPVTNSLRPDFSLQDLDNQLHTASEWNGRVLIINFWATWCPPCRHEMPAFNQLYADYQKRGLTVIGIAIDNKQNVIDFTDPLGIDYPILLGTEKGIQLAKDYGNQLGALPFTVIVDRNGHILHSRRRELSYEDAEALILPLL